MQVILSVFGLVRLNLSAVESQIKICEGPRWEFIVASCVLYVVEYLCDASKAAVQRFIHTTIPK